MTPERLIERLYKVSCAGSNSLLCYDASAMIERLLKRLDEANNAAAVTRADTLEASLP
jgi:hypothetical protein